MASAVMHKEDSARGKAAATRRVESTSKALLEQYNLILSVPNAGKRYELYDELGHGGVAHVYLGYDKDLDRRVAVKVLRGKLQKREGPLARFLNEAKITAKLQNPHIPHVYDVGYLESGELFFSMEVVEGRQLRQLLDERRDNPRALSRERLLRIFLQVCQTVAYAHDNGIVHRDLKPENVMVGSYGEVFVMDWGLGRDLKSEQDDSLLLAANEQGGSAKGTPKYMSPEQVLGMGKRADARGDVFALGVILYELLAGQHPFERDDLRQVMHAISHEEAAPLKGIFIDGGLADICAKAMAKLPQRRYAGAKALAEDIERALEHRTVSVRQSRLGYRFYNYLRRHWLLLGVLALVMSLAGWLATLQMEAQQRARANLDLAKIRLNSGRSFQCRVEELRRTSNRATPAEKLAVYRQLLQVQGSANAELASARALLTVTYRDAPGRFPPWAAEALRELWLAELQALLREEDFRRAHKCFQELADEAPGPANRLSWNAAQLRELEACRQALRQAGY